MKIFLRFILFCCSYNFFVQKHYIVYLLTLELILIRIYSLIIFNNYLLGGTIILFLGVIEGTVGLSLLVSLTKAKNIFFVNRFSVIKC